MAHRFAQLGLASILLPAVLGAPSHANNHQQFHEKRDIVYETDVEYATAYTTVTAGQEQYTAAPAVTPSSTYAPAPAVSSYVPAPAPVYSAPSDSSSSAAPANTGSYGSGSGSGSGSTGSSSPISSIGGGKKGLGYDITSGDLSAYHGFSWAFDWDKDAAAGIQLPAGAKFVPTLKSLGMESGFASSAIQQGASAVLGYNEPDQSGIAVAQAVAGYGEAGMSQLTAKKILVGSPQPTSTDGVGLPWAEQFAQQCTGDCHFDFFALHWYALDTMDAGSAFSAFKDYVGQCEQALSKYGKPLWFTEFGWLPSAGKSDTDKAAFLALAMPFLEATQSVDRYAFYMAGTGANQIGGAGSAALKQYVSGA